MSFQVYLQAVSLVLAKIRSCAKTLILHNFYVWYVFLSLNFLSHATNLKFKFENVVFRSTLLISVIKNEWKILKFDQKLMVRSQESTNLIFKQFVLSLAVLSQYGRQFETHIDWFWCVEFAFVTEAYRATYRH